MIGRREIQQSEPLDNHTRDHLANERTFLAWVRTSLALLGFGFLLARVGLFLSQIAEPRLETGATRNAYAHEFVITGIVFLALGTLLSAWSGWHYGRTRSAIIQDRYVPAGSSIITISLIAVVGGVVIIALVLVRGADHAGL